jgi:hypothetical protein
MTTKVAVKDNNTGLINYMWECDAEEAARYDPSRHIIQVTRPIPKKNPGGRGW